MIKIKLNHKFVDYENLAFTLIELLTVIAIFAILVSLLFVGLSNAREKGRTIVCINNHRQIWLAWNNYAIDHDDKLVINPDSISGASTPIGWTVGNLREKSISNNTDILINAKHSLFAYYIKQPRIYKCPSDDSDYVRSVAMNCRMNPHRFDGKPAWVNGLGQKYMTFRRLSDIQIPSKMLVVLDERDDSINDSYFGIDNSNTGNGEGIGVPIPYQLIDIPAKWHNNGMATSFADGHVEVHIWKDFILNIQNNYINDDQAKISHTDEIDVRWLQEHATYLK